MVETSETQGRTCTLPSIPWYFLLIANLTLAVVLGIYGQPAPAFATAPPQFDAAVNNVNVMDAAGSPRVFYRGISETLSVASAFGSPSAPNHYTRTVSESLTITSVFPGQSQSTSSAAGPALRTAQYSPAMSQRGDERTNLAFKNLKRGGLLEKSVTGGTQYLNLEALRALPMSPNNLDGDIEGSGNASEPDDSSHQQQIGTVQRYLAAQESMQNAAAVGTGTYGTLLIGAFALAALKSPVASKRRYRLYAVIFHEPSHDRTGLHTSIIVALVVLAAGSIALESSAGQAFADEMASVAYKDTGTGAVSYREWDPDITNPGSATEVNLTANSANVNVVKLLYSPVGQLKVIGVLENDGEISIYYCEFACTSASNWTGPTLVADMGTPTAPRKYFDMAFESTSGDLLIVYDKTTTLDTNDFWYRILDANTLALSTEAGFDYVSDVTLDNDHRYFRMASKPGSDEIAMILMDATAVATTEAFIWNGSSWGNQLTVSNIVTGSIAFEAIGVAYESSSGAAVVFSANDSATHTQTGATARWNGSTWSSVTLYDINPGITTATDARWFVVKANPLSTSNQVMACNVDSSNDLSCRIVDAGIAGTNTRLDPAVVSSTRMYDFAWDPSGSTGVAIYDDSQAATSIKRRTWSGSSWAAEVAITVAVQTRWIVAATDTEPAAGGVTSLWTVYEDTTSDTIGDGEWTGSAFTLNGDSTLTANAGTVNNVEVVSIDFRKSPGKRSMSDSLAVTDSITTIITRNRAIPDSIAISDSISAKVTARAIADSVIVTDGIAKSANKQVGDSIGITDTISYRVSRSVSDNVGMTDAISTSVSRSTSDSLGITDEIRTGVSRSMSESVAATDGIAKSATKLVVDSVALTDDVAAKVTARSVSDSISASDGIAVKITRSVQDGVSITDGTEAKVTARSVADSLNVSDAVTFKVSRSIGDTVAIGDGISAKVTARVIGDSITVTDEIAAKVTARATGDSVAIADTITTGAIRPLSENISVSETVGRVHLAPRSASDSVGVTDSITTSVSRAMSDTIGVTDFATRTMAASRPASETLSVTDSISVTRAVSSSASDTIGVTDAISTSRVTSGSPSDTASISDSITKSVTRSTNDGVAVTDSVSANIAVSKPMSDGTATSDSISIGMSRPVSEAVAISDSVSRTLAPGRATFDTVTVADSTSRTYVAARTSQDTIAVTDSVSVSIARSAAEILGVSDSIEAAFGKQREMSDGVAVIEGISVRVTKSAADAVSISDDIARSLATPRAPSESVAVTDSIDVHRAYSAAIADTIAIADTLSTAQNISISDAITVTEELQMKTPFLNLGDSLAVSDTVSSLVVKERAIADGLTIVDVVARGHLVTISDSVTVAAALTDVSWVRTLDLTEQMTLSGNACTPVECVFNLHLGESLVLADGFAVLRAELADTVSISDAIAAGKSFDKQVSDTLTATDRADYLAKFAPPAGVMLEPIVTTNPATVAPPAAQAVAGNFTMSGGVDQLVADLGIPSVDTTALLPPNTTLVLPTYKVPLTSSSQLPTNSTLMTVKVTSIPANTPVMVPVDMAGTPGIVQGSQVPWMKVEYTPQVDSTDFALVVTPLESQPAGAPAPQADLTPLYIDVRWAGTFAGGTSPGSSSYYATPPTFTFALTDAWANANNAMRDANGVPIISLNLLNEATNTWETIGSDKIDEPTGLTDGQYVYVAHLEHFSTYVVTAETAARGGGRGRTSVGFAVNLLDTLDLSESSKGQPVDMIEEFVGRSFSVVIADRLGISVKPVAYQTLKIGENVDVLIGMEDITQEGILPQTAKATFLVQVANRGANYETFQLNFWYSDQTGKRAYESSQDIEIEPFEAREYTIQVPFSSPGTFVVVAEARSVPQGTLLNAAQFTVNIPWLSIYLNALLAVAAALIAASVTVGMLLMRTVGKRNRLQSQP